VRRQRGAQIGESRRLADLEVMASTEGAL